MSSAVKSLRASDISVLPYKVNKSFAFESSSLYENDIIVYKGYYDSGSSLDSLLQEQLNYFSARQLYYSGFITSSISNTSGSYYYNFEQSTAASGTFEHEIRNFPTQQRSEIRIISIPQILFGERLKPKHFILEDSTAGYYIVDDGNGNLYDISNLGLPYVVDGYVNEDYFVGVDLQSLPLVGNVFYAHGLAIITNSDYLYIFPKDCNLSNATAYYTANDCTVTGLFAYFIPPTPSLTPSPSITISPSTTPSVTVTPSISISISTTPSITATPSVTPTVTVSSTVSPSPTPTVTPSRTSNVSVTPSPTPSITTFTFLRNIDPQPRDYIACGIATSAPLYSSTRLITVGVTRFYTDFAKTTPFNGDTDPLNKWYVVQRTVPTVGPVTAVTINSSGFVTSAVVC